MKCVEQQNIKKLCNFYVSDLHLSVMLLPYINSEINEDVEVTTIFEVSERQNIETVLEKVNVKNGNEILNLNWFNTDNTDDKIENAIEKKLINNKKNTIIIGGNKNYIYEVNQKIDNYINVHEINKSNVKIVNCFNVNEFNNNLNGVVKEYDGILNTLGEMPVK